MNILIDIRLLGRGGLSGVEEYTFQIVDHLLGIDSKNHYELFYNGLRKNPLPPEWLRKSNVTLVDWKIPNKILDLSMRTLSWPKIDSLVKTDIIFSPHFNILAAASKPRILTIHDLSFLHHPHFFSSRQKFWQWLQNFKSQLIPAQKIIADSHFTKADLIKMFGLEESKIAVIYPGINPELKKLDLQDSALQEFRNNRGLYFPFLLYLGTLEPRKNIGAVIRAFSWLKKNKKFSDLKLIIAGRLGWLYQNILKEANASPSRDDIIFWGPASREDKLFLYNLAEAFVYPSFFEGFGFPPLEAQACGTPVVVGNRTSLPEIIGNSGILTDPWRITELAEALAEVLSNQNLRLKLIKAGLANAKRFNWPEVTKAILKLIKAE